MSDKDSLIVQACEDLAKGRPEKWKTLLTHLHRDCESFTATLKMFSRASAINLTDDQADQVMDVLLANPVDQGNFISINELLVSFAVDFASCSSKLVNEIAKRIIASNINETPDLAHLVEALLDSSLLELNLTERLAQSFPSWIKPLNQICTSMENVLQFLFVSPIRLSLSDDSRVSLAQAICKLAVELDLNCRLIESNVEENAVSNANHQVQQLTVLQRIDELSEEVQAKPWVKCDYFAAFMMEKFRELAENPDAWSTIRRLYNAARESLFNQSHLPILSAMLSSMLELWPKLMVNFVEFALKQLHVETADVPRIMSLLTDQVILTDFQPNVLIELLRDLSSLLTNPATRAQRTNYSCISTGFFLIILVKNVQLLDDTASFRSLTKLSISKLFLTKDDPLKDFPAPVRTILLLVLRAYNLHESIIDLTEETYDSLKSVDFLREMDKICVLRLPMTCMKLPMLGELLQVRTKTSKILTGARVWREFSSQKGLKRRSSSVFNLSRLSTAEKKPR